MTGEQESNLSEESSKRIEAIRDEARLELDPSRLGSTVDWARLEGRLFERIAAPSASVLAERRISKRMYVASSVALAAAILVAIGFAPAEPNDAFGGKSAAVRASEASVSTTFRREGAAGDILVDGVATSSALTLSKGTTLETRGARAVFPSVSGVAWTAEDGTKVRVERAEPFVVALERGAVEAQVTPVAYGEAYAVDIETVRVAVHGTHLRVARLGEKVTVDLSEGVIAIGSRPQRGSTIGTSIAAPAHVEFDPKDVVGTMKIEHAPGAVRPPFELTRGAQVQTPPLAAMHVEPKDLIPMPPPRRDDVTPVKANSAAVPSSVTIRDPKQFALAEVNRCWGESSGNDGLKVVVESSLEVRVNKSLSAELVRFDPPLSPSVQECVSKALLRGVYSRAETVVIPIKLSR